MARLEFAGARYVRNYHLAVPHHELEIDRKKSLSEKPSLEDNLIIHGDNLKALKSLLPHYAGKVKCIYIDPPYNTGNEDWRYNDNVSLPRHKEWLGKVVDKECLDRHDRWLSMMTPRLKLLKELLRNDGAIFISIGEDEIGTLRMLMDEIFGENFIATICWQKKQSPQNDAVNLSDMHDFVLVYAKQKKEKRDDPAGWSRGLIPRSEEQDARYSNRDNDPRGDWTSSDYSCNKSAEERPNLYYAIINPVTKKEVWPSKRRVWAYEKEVSLCHIKENRIWWGDEGDGVPRLKKFRSDVEEGVVPSTWWDRDFAGDNQAAKREIQSILGIEDDIFETPKPTQLLARILQIATKPQCDDIVLDSFSGSGTTAHAVLALNREDGGNRKFILVEQEDYADKITAERVRRVIKGVKSAKDEKLKNGFGGSFTYVTLGAEYDVGKILSGKSLPKYEEMAAYVFQTATGETLDRKEIDKKSKFIGSSKFYDVHLLYEPNIDKLKSKECALTLDFVEALPKDPKKKQLVFGAVRYVNQETLARFGVEFSQLPYEVYRRIDDAS